MPENDNQQNNQPTQQPTEQRPTWLPENFKSPEDLAKSYQELEKWKGSVSPQIELAKKWEQWGDPDTFEGRVQGYIDKQVAERESALKRGDTRSAQQAQDNIDNATVEFENLTAKDLDALEKTLTPRMQQYLDQRVDAYWKKAQGQLGMVGQQQDLLTRALDVKLKNPDVNLNQIWKYMADLATADSGTLMNKALESVLAPQVMEQKIKDAVAAERAKWEQEAKNKQMAVINGSNTLSQALKSNEGRPKGRDAIRQKILSEALQNGVITADQL